MTIFARIIAALEEAEKAKGTIFDDFVDTHSGIEHIAGATKGGTFFLVGGLSEDDVIDDSPWSIRHSDKSTGHVDEDDGDATLKFADFDAGVQTDDAIDFSGHSGANDIGDIVATQVGLETTIGLGADSITLLGVSTGDLHTDDFIF